MHLGDEKKMYQECLRTKQKWEEIISKNIPFPCKKCGVQKYPHEFVKHYMDNEYAGRYQFLHECKECKRKRTYEKRKKDRSSIEGAVNLLHKNLFQGAKKRNISFEITKNDLLELREQQQGKCYYTGYEMNYEFVNEKKGTLTEKTMFQVSCDRLDNNYGYTKENTVLCTTLANRMKSILDSESFLQTCKDIVKYHKL